MHQERRQVAELEGAGDLEEDGESEFYIKETTGKEDEEEAGQVDDSLPCTSTTTLKGVPFQTSTKWITPPMPSKIHKHQDTCTKLDEPPIEKLMIKICRPPHTS